MAKKLVAPRVHALVICEDIEDRWDGDELQDLLGVRTYCGTPIFPFICPQLCVYMQATGHQGTARCCVVIVRAENDTEVLRTTEEEIPFTGPLDFIHIRFWIANCVFPDAGLYYVQVFFDHQLRSERAFDVLASEGEANGRVS